jgi:hypothetical protein
MVGWLELSKSGRHVHSRHERLHERLHHTRQLIMQQLDHERVARIELLPLELDSSVVSAFSYSGPFVLWLAAPRPAGKRSPPLVIGHASWA